jgi:hypothetical protein
MMLMGLGVVRKSGKARHGLVGQVRQGWVGRARRGRVWWAGFGGLGETPPVPFF